MDPSRAEDKKCRGQNPRSTAEKAKEQLCKLLAGTIPAQAAMQEPEKENWEKPAEGKRENPAEGKEKNKRRMVVAEKAHHHDK